ncbi:MAG: TIGR01212 family radical SAM protein, partial [Bdellovibrio sp.]
SSRWDELVAPAWTKNKMGTHQAIIDHLRAKGSYQSQLFTATNEADRLAQAHLHKKSIFNP